MKDFNNLWTMLVSAVYLYDIQLNFEETFDLELKNTTSPLYKEAVQNISVAVSV